MPKKPQRTFWARAKEALTEARLPPTQVYLAKFLDIEQPSVSDWNKPDGYPTIERVVAIAKHTGVCVEWLYSERGPKRPVPQDEAAQRLWDLWPQIDDITKGELIGRATQVAQRRTKSDPDPHLSEGSLS